MSALFSEHVRVRAYECDALGHVNNAVYIQYLLQGTLDAAGAVNGRETLPTARRLAIESHTPARYGDELEIATWFMGEDDYVTVRGYTIARVPDGARIAAAQIDWDKPSGLTQATPTVERVGMPHSLKPFVPPQDNGARPFRCRLGVRRSEIDSKGRVGASVYFNWLEEATFRAAGRAGWSLERMRASDFITLQFRHDAEFVEPALEGDEVEIISRLIQVRRVRGTWIHEIRRATGNALLMRDYSTGAFLDWSGKVRAAPEEMMESLIRGEPASE